ncbi:MAG: hypothetical protein ACOC95_08110 [Planctomycetota bacterium]
MVGKIDNRKDILLLLLYSPGRADEVNEPIVGKTRLVKMLFLFKEEAMHHFRRGIDIADEEFYQFFPWSFGPFSRDVYDDIEFFVLREFIESRDSDEDALPESAAEWEEWLSSSRPDSSEDSVREYNEEVFQLTPAGAKFASDLYQALSPGQKKLLREFKRRITNAPLRAILKYVYENYEDMTAKSEIREQILGNG